MMKKCPECGSGEIVPNLIVFADDSANGLNPPYVKLVEPEPVKRPFVWVPKHVASGFRAAVCGACGHTEFYTNRHAEILEAHRKGYTSQTCSLNVIPIP
ncbi:MAG: hypothetical protein FJZ87_00075 [Chloroflexi bacterium]|nr:hypothetical protein [Chloroflexota bacterium]